ncbi:MAG: DUF368 domain-containing protein [Acetatifactor sp.]
MIKNIFKGIVIGIANIVPGVSGGTMMVAMGIYDKLIHCITHLFSEFKKSILFVWPIALGMVVAIAGSSFGLTWLFDNFPLQTNLLFVGLILGGLPAIYGKVKGKKVKVGHMIAGLLFFALVAGMAVMGEPVENKAELTFNLVNTLKLVGVGIIASATMIIPGVSGSMVLMLLGFYFPVLNAIKELVAALIKFDVPVILSNCGILVPFGIGIVAGVFGIAKLMEIVFEKFPLYAYWAIIGLIVASPIAILLQGTYTAVTVLGVVTGAISLAAGFVVAMKLGE